MRLSIRCPGFAFSPCDRAALVADLRRKLSFALMRHEASAAALRVEITRGRRGGAARIDCAVEGVIEPFGAIAVSAGSAQLHEAVERALHRLEIRLVEALLAREPGLPRRDRPSAQQAA